MDRRTLLKVAAAASAALAGSPGIPLASRLFTSPLGVNLLRPPGALAEDRFTSTCIRCGRCVEICPYHCIAMLDLRHGLNAGTPLIQVQNIPCFLCMKCVHVCPTGALQPLPQAAVRMGTAVVNQFTCISWIGTALCRTCFDKCPFKGSAITLEELKPVVHAAHCTGCGLCTYACPVTAPDGFKAVNVQPPLEEV